MSMKTTTFRQKTREISMLLWSAIDNQVLYAGYHPFEHTQCLLFSSATDGNVTRENKKLFQPKQMKKKKIESYRTSYMMAIIKSSICALEV